MVEMTDANIVLCRDGRPQVYEITVKCEDSEWVIFRRYSDFERLHAELRRMMVKPLQLPPKGLMLRKSSREARFQGLQQFLTETIRLQPFLTFNSKPFTQFFGWSTVYWEKQKEGLCAVHCLNNLLQGPFFTSDDLEDTSKKLDQNGMQLLAPGSKKVSFRNMISNGNFSIEVVIQSLQAMGLAAQEAMHEDSREHFLKQPELEEAYIVNAHRHWFAVRKLQWFGHLAWFDLNSTAGAGPTRRDTTELSALLHHPENSSVLIVRGKWPHPHSHDSDLAPKSHQRLLGPTDLERMQKRYRDQKASKKQVRDRRDSPEASKTPALDRAGEAGSALRDSPEALKTPGLDNVDYAGGAGSAVLGMTVGAAVFPCFHGVYGAILGAVLGWRLVQNQRSLAA